MEERCVVEIGGDRPFARSAVAAANPEEAGAKAELDALLYDQHSEDGTFVGTAEVSISRVGVGSREERGVCANEDYREGRPFVDSIEIQMGRSAHDRMLGPGVE